MAKKKEIVVEPIVEEYFEAKVVPKLGKLGLSFGREDLDKLKDKVNEIVDFLNK